MKIKEKNEEIKQILLVYILGLAGVTCFKFGM